MSTPRREPTGTGSADAAIDVGAGRIRCRGVLTPTAAPTEMTVAPGPGEPAVPPHHRRQPASSTRRPFRAPVDAWRTAGTDQWWRVRLEGLPPASDGTQAERRRVYERTRTTWDREVKRQRAAGLLAGEFTSHLVEEGGATYFYWGPKPVKGAPGTSAREGA